MPILHKTWTFLKNKLLLLAACFLPVFSFAQDTGQNTSGLYADGKIYVVVLVISTIFVGIILFLIYIERKIKRLENKSSQNI